MEATLWDELLANEAVVAVSVFPHVLLIECTLALKRIEKSLSILFSKLGQVLHGFLLYRLHKR